MTTIIRSIRPIRWLSKFAALAACLLAAAAQAQGAKQELVAKVLQLQQPGIETMARTMVEQPAQSILQQVANLVRQRVPADKREALGKEIQADVRKFVDETTPVLRERAVKLAPSTIGAVLEEKMTEDELRELIKILESPVNRKFSSLGGEMQRALGEKLVAETRSTVQARLQTLNETLNKRMAPYGSAASAPR